MARLLFRLGAVAYRRRGLILVIWLLVLAAAAVGAGTLSGKTTSSFSIPGQESTTALARIKQEFGTGGGATARVVVKAPEGQKLTAPDNVPKVGALVSELGRLPGVANASNPLDPKAPAVNPDQSTAYSTVGYRVPAGSVTADEKAALTAAVEHARASGLTVEIGGDIAGGAPKVGGVVEGLGVALALLILALTYGSLVMAGMNLLTAAVGVAIGVLGVTVTTGFVELSSTTPILATMLGLAVGIDYALFIINRYRQELRHGAEVDTAVATAVATAGSAVLTAGITVIIALAGLAVAGIPFLTQMGIAAAATIVVAVLVALTLVPAVLGFLGRRALPKRQRTGAVEVRERGFYRGWVSGVTRHRVVALALSVITLGIIAIPVVAMRTTLVPTPTADSTQARAERLLADGFGPGFNGPITILFEGPEPARAVAAIQGAGDIAHVTEPRSNGKGAALITVVPESGPTTVATEQLVTELRARLSTVDGATTYVTGSTAVSVDVAITLDRALPVYLAVVVGLALVLLVLVFRSLPVPLVGVLGFLLTIGASLGATVAVFQWGWLGAAVNLDTTGPLISLTPIIVIGILFGLAMDYQVFLVSRMHEAHHRGERPLSAVTTGFRQAAPVVVAAALIMFSVFAGFVPGGEPTIKSIAFALAIGIAVDAFVVRMVLVPAALALIGERAWWLPRLLAWLPVLDVEGTGLRRPAESPDLVDATR